MKPLILTLRFLPAAGMAFFPFIIVKKHSLKKNEVLLNHERIHLRQQAEMLILPFYLFYLLHYLLNIFRYFNHDQAYLNIVFEREAYQNDHNSGYLKSRRLFAWIYYFHQPKQKIES